MLMNTSRDLEKKQRHSTYIKVLEKTLDLMGKNKENHS